jgi:hypothetical protein
MFARDLASSTSRDVGSSGLLIILTLKLVQGVPQRSS